MGRYYGRDEGRKKLDVSIFMVRVLCYRRFFEKDIGCGRAWILIDEKLQKPKGLFVILSGGVSERIRPPNLKIFIEWHGKR